MKRRTKPSGFYLEQFAPFILIGIALALLCLTWVVFWLAGEPVPARVFDLPFAIARGEVRVTPVVAGIIILVGLVIAVPLVWWLRRPVDVSREFRDRGKLLGSRREVAAILSPAAKTKAERWGISQAGIMLGELTSSPSDLVTLSWEDVSVTFAGMRSGKTMAIAIPIICQGPGPVVVTSTKQDVFHHTVGVRANLGDVWVFDPMHIISTDEPEWWWDLLSACTSVSESKEMAAQLIASTRQGSVKGDFWDSEAADLIGFFLFAAHIDGKQLDTVYDWVNNEVNEEAADILDAHGYHTAANAIRSVTASDPRTRAGVFITAKQAFNWFADPAIARWVTCTPDEPRYAYQFDPAAFATSTDTMYLLSKNRGGGGALVAALTLTICKTAIEVANEPAHGGHLPLPMQLVLDECANICRIVGLPDYMSYFGSHFVNIHPIFQNLQQVVENWGQTGPGRIVASSNFTIIAPGINDDHFLRELSNLVGNWDRPMVSRSFGTGSTNHQHSTTREAILPVEELRAIPPWHALVLASTVRPVTMRMRPWWERDGMREAVQASLDAYLPTGMSVEEVTDA